MTTEVMPPPLPIADARVELSGRLEGLITAAISASDEAIALTRLTDGTPTAPRGERTRIEQAVAELRDALASHATPAARPVELSERALRCCDGSRIELTSGEITLLALLMRETGNAVSHDHIAQALQGEHGADRYRRSAIRTTVYTLRQKMRAAGAGPQIETVRGFGYRLWWATADEAGDTGDTGDGKTLTPLRALPVLSERSRAWLGSRHP